MFELTQLVGNMPLCKVILTIDETTDEDYLCPTVQTALQVLDPISPNYDGIDIPLRVQRIEKQQHSEVRKLLSLLCDAVFPAA